MRKVESALDLIGSTPIVRLRRLPQKEDATVWAKLECFNPGGSVKDRICLSMIQAAEKIRRLAESHPILKNIWG